MPQPPAEFGRGRAIRLFSFLKKISELRAKHVKSIDEYENVLWIADIPPDPDCHTIWSSPASAGSSDSWIEVTKPRLREPPEMPHSLGPWVDYSLVADSANGPPELYDRIMVEDTSRASGAKKEPVEDHLHNHPEIRKAWTQYVNKAWRPWAEEDRRLQRIQSIYTGLFSIYQRQERLGEIYEVVLGLGCLVWKTPSNQEIKRHLITAKASIVFEPLRGVISLGPAAEGARPALEQDMLEVHECPGHTEQKEIEALLGDLGDDVWDRGQMGRILQMWVHAVSPHGSYEDTMEHEHAASENPRVLYAPSVILRKRTERSLIRALQEIIDQLQRGEPIPDGIERLIELAESPGEKSDLPADVQPDDEIYFPLPANEQQSQIVTALTGHDGVLVQGPPGTGKSHTIANLICHLLATGNRVLITSQTARALRVLREKIPPEIRALCVSLLGDDRGALRMLEESVSAITGQHARWDENENKRQIEHLRQQLEAARGDETQIIAAMKSIREKETYTHQSVFGHSGTAAEIAGQLRRHAPDYEWIRARPAEDHSPPLTDSEATELLRVLRETGIIDEADLGRTLVDIAELMAPADLLQQVRQEAVSLEQYGQCESLQQYPARELLERTDPERRGTLVDSLSELVVAYENAMQQTASFAVKDAALQIMTGSARTWHELRHATGEHLQAMGDLARKTGDKKVTGLGGRDLSAVKADASGLYAHLAAGKGLGFGPLRPRPVKEALYLLADVRIDGKRCDKAKTLAELLEWVDVALRLERLADRWRPHAKIADGSFSTLAGQYHDLHDALAILLGLEERTALARKAIAAIPGLAEPDWGKVEELVALQKNAAAIALHDDYVSAKARLDEPAGRLSPACAGSNVHPAIPALLAAVEGRDTGRYAELYQFLMKLQTCRELYNRLSTAAPALAKDILASVDEEVWDQRLCRFTKAWDWARADSWLAGFNEPDALQELARKLEQCRHGIGRILCRLAAAKAWQQCFARMNAAELAHLKSWRVAVDKIGKGTGKYAAQHRRDAQGHMEKCRTAIPAWIMPIYRVAESIKPGKDVFDVVIVDEASQSGNEALFLMYLAKKIIVVGDDKQISPDNVGVDREQVNFLRRQLIEDLPLQDNFGMDTSLYTHAYVLFRNAIKLREHFRCMPEIIQFSNDLCYADSPLEPLKQFGADRLEPIHVVHVTDGYRQGGDNPVNPPEAEAVAARIIACCNEPRYQGKTMGVISLQGSAQAAFIERILLQSLGPEEMERRNLICGDAYSFQGDERDIIFMSLVAAPSREHRIGSLDKHKDVQRFNVAASRAKEQMWLFHTATLDDLSRECLRHRLLQYCLNPRRQPVPLTGKIMDPDMLEAHLFDNLFAQHVFIKIQERGYRVIPRYEVGGYVIDMVVEGRQARLAVGCDGDCWPGPEQWERDMGRQRDLERCGYRFWRVRASTFYRDPDAALAGLWTRLEKEGIQPASEENTPSVPVEIIQGAMDPGPTAPRRAAPRKRTAKPRPVTKSKAMEPNAPSGAPSVERAEQDGQTAKKAEPVDAGPEERPQPPRSWRRILAEKLRKIVKGR